MHISPFIDALPSSMRPTNFRKFRITEKAAQYATADKPSYVSIVVPAGYTSSQSMEWDFIGEFTKPDSVIKPKEETPPNLADALTDLHDAREEADEEEFTAPSDLTLENAERLLRAMHEILPCRYEVYPMPDGEIAIDAPTSFGTAVIAMCEPDGNVLCFVHTEQDKNYRRFPFAELPNEFLRNGLLELGSVSN